MPYGPLFELLNVALFAKAMETYHWKASFTALFCVLTPPTIYWLISLISGQTTIDLTFTHQIVELTCQYIVALVVFHFLSLYEDTITVWLAWLVLGGVAIFITVPMVIRLAGI